MNKLTAHKEKVLQELENGEYYVSPRMQEFILNALTERDQLICELLEEELECNCPTHTLSNKGIRRAIYMIKEGTK